MYRKYFKSVIDITGAATILIILLPIAIIFLPLFYFSNSGHIFFTQLRPGINGRLFHLVKFKTMNDKRDSSGKLLSDHERLTIPGRFIRSLSIDELPQLINVIKGEMSLIGPRPLLPRYLPLYNEHQLRRHNVKPGITGWAQVNGRNTISWQQKFDYDVWYVDNVTFMLDLKILFLTVKKVLFREGINAGERVTMGEFRGNVEKQA